MDQVQEQALGNTQTAAKKRKVPPKCSLCGHPTKGHSKESKKTIVLGILLFC